MTYSTGGYGYPSQDPNTGGFGASPGYGGGSPGGPGKGLPFFLNIGVVALGVLSFLLGFAPFAEVDKDAPGSLFSEDRESFSFFFNFVGGAGVIGLSLVLAAALIAAFGLVPKQSPHESVVAGLSLTGFLTLLFVMIGIGPGLQIGIGLILVLIISFIQAALAIAGLMFAGGVIKQSSPSQYGGYGQSSYGQPQSGGYGQSQGGYGQQSPPPSQPQPQAQPQGGYGQSQPTQQPPQYGTQSPPPAGPTDATTAYPQQQPGQHNPW